MTLVLLLGLQAAPELVDVRKIWDKAPHNAFTDLARHKDRWWCVFREGRHHVSPDGSLRVLTSADGEAWESAALLRREGDGWAVVERDVGPCDYAWPSLFAQHPAWPPALLAYWAGL